MPIPSRPTIEGTLPVSNNDKLNGTIFDDFIIGEPSGYKYFDPPAIPPGNWGTAGGNDTIYASAGNDTIDGGDRIVTPLSSQLDCVDYSKWGTKIYVNLNTVVTPQPPYVDPYGVSVALIGVVFKGNGLFDYYVADSYSPFARSSIECIYGTAFADEILGNSKDNYFKGNAGNDKIFANDGNDTVLGDAGNDTLKGEGGNDTLNGGGNNDCIYGGAGQDTADGGAGNDKIWGEAGRDSILGNAGLDTVWGGLERDSICGNDGNDSLFGDNGNITEAAGGADCINGGKGADTLKGEEGNDTLDGDLGSDSVYGNGGDDLLVEDNCAKTLCGPTGDDGDDVLDGGSGSDIFTNTGNDTLAAWNGDDTLYGRDGNDVLYGEYGFDSVVGSDGDDYITGDCLLFRCEEPPVPPVPVLPDGNDTLLGGNGNDTVYGDFCEIECVPVGEYDCSDTLNVRQPNGEAVAEVDGLTFNDYITGDAGDDVLNGELGDDTISGGTGNDTISDGPGADTVDAGAGSDVMCAGDDDAVDLFIFGCDSYVTGEKDVIYDLERCFNSVECEADVVDVAGAAIALGLDWNVPCITPADCVAPYDPADLDCLYDTLVLGLFAPFKQIFLDNNVDADGDGAYDDSALTFVSNELVPDTEEPAEYVICFINQSQVSWAGDELNPFLLVA